ncbi:hypothetical protein [Hydrocarboniphaga effusa]
MITSAIALCLLGIFFGAIFGFFFGAWWAIEHVETKLLEAELRNDWRAIL